MAVSNKSLIFALAFDKEVFNMVVVVQLVRASDCGSECRGFESHLPPLKIKRLKIKALTAMLMLFFMRYFLHVNIVS